MNEVINILQFIDGFIIKRHNAKIHMAEIVEDGKTSYQISFIKMHDRKLTDTEQNFFDNVVERFGRHISAKTLNLKKETLQAFAYGIIHYFELRDGKSD